MTSAKSSGRTKPEKPFEQVLTSYSVASTVREIQSQTRKSISFSILKLKEGLFQ